jgi:parvulin-like peptidyl-prolyl isomerase
MAISIVKRTAAVISGLMFFALGCARPPEADKRVVAKINNYEMTVSDFREEARLTRSNKSLSPDEAKAKAQLLEALINKKILIQEALKLNFDKDKTFMKEIERYWEQALLKLLFKIKSDELSRTVRVDDFEIRQAFAKMRKKIFAQFVVLSDKSAAQQLSQATSNFDDLKNSFKGYIRQETTEWWSWGDLPGAIEDILFGLKPGEISQAFQYSDNWAVARVLKEEDVETGPIEKMAPYIRDELLKQKKTEALDDWIDSVTKKAKVKINQKLLEEIKIE